MNPIIQSARDFAIRAHGDQKYGEHPYYKHLQDVSDVLLRFGFTKDDDSGLHAAAWLHDTLEDTNATFAEIENLFVFGRDVADIVWRVTNESGKNRRERHEKTYPKIIESLDAIILKLADRIANVENCLANNPGLLSMYRKEYADFRSALCRDQVDTARMWAHLDAMMFDRVSF